MNATAPGSSSSFGSCELVGQQPSDRGGVGAVLDGEQVARVVPRQRREDRGAARGGPREAQPLGHDVQPPSGRSKTTWAEPVPIAFSYAEYCAPARRARPTADRRHRHEVVAEATLGPEPQVLGHVVDDRAMLTARPAVEHLVVRRGGLLGEDVLLAGRLVGAQLAQRPERVAERARADEEDPTVEPLDRAAHALADGEEVVGLPGLGDAHRHPSLGALEEAEEVDRRVVDRQALVVDRGDPAVLDRRGLGGEGLGELGVALDVVGDLGHPAGELLGGVATRAARLGGDDELDRREPVRVEDHDEVGPQHVEDLPAHVEEPGVQRRLLAVVERAPLLVGEHDRGDVREHRGADDLTHGWSPPSPGRS